MSESLIDVMARYAGEEHKRAADRGLTLAEHYLDLAQEAAVAQAGRDGKLSVDGGEAILRWAIENSPGIGALSPAAISDIVSVAVDIYHDRRAQIAAEGGADD